MKALVVFYSFGGTTADIVKKKAEENGADLIELKYEKKPSIIGAFLKCPAAMSRKKAKLLPFDADWESYDMIVLAAPVWAGYPAPPFNNAVEALPSGKNVEIVLVSGSGKSSKREETISLIETKGCKLFDYLDIKA